MNLLATLIEIFFESGMVLARISAGAAGGVFYACLILTIYLLFASARKKQRERDRRAARRAKRAQREQELSQSKRKAAKKEEKRQRKEKILAHFETLYEQKKQAIGNITCPQCQWQGEWGTGITFRHYYAEPLKNNGIKVTEEELVSGKLSGNNQFLCPVCNSMNWSKV